MNPHRFASALALSRPTEPNTGWTQASSWRRLLYAATRVVGCVIPNGKLMVRWDILCCLIFLRPLTCCACGREFLRSRGNKAPTRESSPICPACGALLNSGIDPIQFHKGALVAPAGR